MSAVRGGAYRGRGCVSREVGGPALGEWNETLPRAGYLSYTNVLIQGQGRGRGQESSRRSSSSPTPAPPTCDGSRGCRRVLASARGSIYNAALPRRSCPVLNRRPGGRLHSEGLWQSSSMSRPAAGRTAPTPRP